LCARWVATLRRRAPQLRVRRNYPYLGRADGLTTYLRRRFPAGAYIGVELEVNQRHLLSDTQSTVAARAAVVDSVVQLFG
jgi:hypothetical protein